MGIYGHKFDNLLLENKYQAFQSKSVSVVYEEYLNRKNLLEACIDSNERTILESQVELLQEISIKDIFERIKEALGRFVEWIRKLIEKVKNFFTGAKYKAAEKEIEELKKQIDEEKLKNVAVGDLEKEVNKLKAELKQAENNADREKEEREIASKKYNDEIDNLKDQRQELRVAVKEKDKSISSLESKIKQLESLKDKISEYKPILFFNANNYLDDSFSPQKIANNAQDIIKKMNSEYKASDKESIKKFLDEYEKYLYILNDETKKRLGDNYLLRHGGVSNYNFSDLCKKDMEEEAAKFKGADMAAVYKRVAVGDYYNVGYLIEILDGYELFAQNLMKASEKEFDVTYSQHIGNSSSGVTNDRDENVDYNKFKEKEKAIHANELFKRIDTAIDLAKASVTACGTLIKYEGEAVGAAREFMRVASIISNKEE